MTGRIAVLHGGGGLAHTQSKTIGLYGVPRYCIILELGRSNHDMILHICD